jgi:HK97 family phage major capsid protein
MADSNDTDEQTREGSEPDTGDDPIVTVETARELLNDDDTDMSGAVREELEGLLEERGGAGNDSSGSDPHLNPDAGEEPGGRTQVIGPIIEPWKERAVQYLDARAAQFEARHGIGTTSRQESERAMQEVRQEAAQMPRRQMADELRSAVETLDEAGISDSKRAAYVSALQLRDVQERLHTTSTSDTPSAGYLLPKPFLAELFVILEDFGLVRRLFRTVPMSSKDIDLKNVLGKVVAFWTDEGANIEASDLQLGEEELVNKGLKGITSWTRELEEDMAISLLPAVQEQFAESIAEKEDKAGLLGDGSSTYGGFTGLLNLSGANTVTASSGNTTASDAVTEDNLRAMRDDLSQARKQNAVFIMSDTIQSLVAKIEDGGGNRIFHETIEGQEPNRLLGYPIEISEAMPDASSVGAGEPFVIFGNPQRALLGQRRGLTADVSEEAVIQDSAGDIVYNAFQAEGSLLRISERVGFKVPQAWQDSFSVLETAAS